MRARLDDEQPELLDEPSFLYLGIQVALLLLVLSLWLGKDFDLLASSQRGSGMGCRDRGADRSHDCAGRRFPRDRDAAIGLLRVVSGL